VYTVRPGAMDAWVAEWREHVYPLRRALGFSIPAAWVVEDGDRFVWLLEYDGAEYEAANAAYYDSPERQALDPDPARHLSATEHWPLLSVLPR
jgi:NIPSNAP